MDKSKIVLYGHSLGGAVALHLAAENADRVSAVIAENTFLRIVPHRRHRQGYANHG